MLLDIASIQHSKFSKLSTPSRPRGGEEAGLTGVRGKVTVCCDGRDIISFVVVWFSGVEGGVWGDVAGVRIPDVVSAAKLPLLGEMFNVLMNSPVGFVVDPIV